MLSLWMVMLVPTFMMGQDPSFSLFNINRIYLNPAYTGGTGDLSVGFNSRSQWTRVPSSFSTNMGYVQGGCPNWNLGLGLRFYDDVEGEGYMRNTNFAGLVAVHLPGRFKNTSIRSLRNKKFIWSFGLQLAVGQRKLDWSRLVFSDQLDPYAGLISDQSQIRPQNEVSNMVFDMGAGTRFRFSFGKRGSYVSSGVAAFHINQPVESFFNMETRLLPRYTAYLYTHFQTSKYTNNPKYLCIGWVMDHQQVQRTNMLNLEYDLMSNLMIGIAYRKKEILVYENDFDAFVLSFMYSIADLTIGYSYDFTMPKLGLENTAGTHEIGIIYTFKGTYLCSGRGRNRSRAIDCYDLELSRGGGSSWRH